MSLYAIKIVLTIFIQCDIVLWGYWTFHSGQDIYTGVKNIKVEYVGRTYINHSGDILGIGLLGVLQDTKNTEILSESLSSSIMDQSKT